MLTQVITYECCVEASSHGHAVETVERLIADGDEPDMYEVDSGDFEVVWDRVVEEKDST